MTCAALGLDEQAVKDYIKQNKPTYPEFEAWVKKNAKSLNAQAIEKHNAAVRGYNHDDETRKGILGAGKITDDAAAAEGRRESKQSRRLVRISSGRFEITNGDYKPRNSRAVPENSCAISFAGSFIDSMSWPGFASPNGKG